jgi:hypothetical protein
MDFTELWDWAQQMLSQANVWVRLNNVKVLFVIVALWAAYLLISSLRRGLLRWMSRRVFRGVRRMFRRGKTMTPEQQRQELLRLWAETNVDSIDQMYIDGRISKAQRRYLYMKVGEMTQTPDLLPRKPKEIQEKALKGRILKRVSLGSVKSFLSRREERAAKAAAQEAERPSNRIKALFAK